MPSILLVPVQKYRSLASVIAPGSAVIVEEKTGGLKGYRGHERCQSCRRVSLPDSSWWPMRTLSAAGCVGEASGYSARPLDMGAGVGIATVAVAVHDLPCQRAG
jgi:hypothetical protein